MLTALRNMRSATVLWLMEDNLRWKTTFGWRQPSVEDGLWWILAYCLVRLVAFLGSMLPQYMALSVRLFCSSRVSPKKIRRLRFGVLTALTNLRSTKVLWYVEDDLRWKTTFCGGRPSVEGDLWLKTTFSGRQPSVEDNFWWKTILACFNASLT